MSTPSCTPPAARDDSIRSGIGSVILRPASHLTKDRSAPNVGADHQKAERDQDAHEAYYLDLGMERWLPYVADLSFETTAIPLTMADAKLLRDAYAHLHGRTYYEDTSMPTVRLLRARVSPCCSAEGSMS